MMKDVGDTMGYWQKDPVSLVEICSWMKMGYFLKSSRTCWLTELPQHFDIRRSWAQALLSAVWAVDADFFLGVRAPSGLDLGFAAVSVAAVRGSSFFHWLRGQKDKKWHSLCPWQETLSTLLVMHGLGANGSPLFCHIFCLLGCCTYYNIQYIIYICLSFSFVKCEPEYRNCGEQAALRPSKSLTPENFSVSSVVQQVFAGAPQRFYGNVNTEHDSQASLWAGVSHHCQMDPNGKQSNRSARNWK